MPRLLQQQQIGKRKNKDIRAAPGIIIKSMQMKSKMWMVLIAQWQKHPLHPASSIPSRTENAASGCLCLSIIFSTPLPKKVELSSSVFFIGLFIGVHLSQSG